jgi:hypothetical protein
MLRWTLDGRGPLTALIIQLQLTGTGTIFAPSKGSVNSNAVDEPIRKDAIEGSFMVGWILAGCLQIERDLEG